MKEKRRSNKEGKAGDKRGGGKREKEGVTRRGRRGIREEKVKEKKKE
ncbi:hypothetical protein [Paraflavitalea speifideaquila]|nr:hypothetical protein [Paraflavitalea speifideiaquila]